MLPSNVHIFENTLDLWGLPLGIQQSNVLLDPLVLRYGTTLPETPWQNLSQLRKGPHPSLPVMPLPVKKSPTAPVRSIT